MESREDRLANAKTYMRNYNRISARIERIEDRLEQLTEDLESVKSPAYDAMPKAPMLSLESVNKIPNLIIKQIEVAEELAETKADCLELLDDIEMKLNKLAPKYSRLLYDKYIRGLDWRAVAEHIGYSEEYARKELHESALLALREIL